jgi:hypothetical protein
VARRVALIVLAVAILAAALLVAASLPSELCTYDGDSGGCLPGNPAKVIVGLGGIAVGIGIVIWAYRRRRPSHWEARARRG